MTELTYITLNKLSKTLKDEESFQYKLLLMGNCATQHLATAIKGYAAYVGLKINLLDVDYNLIDAQVIDTNSDLYSFKPDYVLLYLCSEKLFNEFSVFNNKEEFADHIYSRITSYWDTINSRLKTNIIQFSFVEINDSVFGNYGCKAPSSFIYQIRKLNNLVVEGAQQYKNVLILDLNSIQMSFGRSQFFDDKFYYMAKLPISLNALPEVAKNVIDIINAIRGVFKKCVICDLDNTLWGGVIGDDGIEGIQIGELGVGHAFEEFQRYLLLLKERGIILAVCSKNNEETAKEPFIKHPEMVLKLDDFAVFVANWEDKASNIKYIQKILNIGMDSIVFFDDNSFERNLVKSIIPEITVPELPEDPAHYVGYIRSLNLFETASFSSEDKNRTKQYQSEINRINSQKMFSSYEEYLESLEMVAGVKPFDDFNTPRLAQLSQRSNQFNLRTVRLTEENVQSLIKDDSYIATYFTLKDKFGDHGLISMVILKKINNEQLFVENWLMSCRVLKRGVEEFVSDTIVKSAKDNGFKSIVAEYIPTPKNSMVKDLYKNMGFVDDGNNKYHVDVDKYVYHKTYIKKGE